MFSGEARQRSSSSRRISTCVREFGAAAAASSPLPSFFFAGFGWHGRTGPLPKDNTQVGELARFLSLMNERNHELTVVGMDQKPAAKPPEPAPRLPKTPAVAMHQTAAASKARALAFKGSLPGKTAVVRSLRSLAPERTEPRRRTATAAAAEATRAQQRRAGGLVAARVSRSSRAGRLVSICANDPRQTQRSA